jgi:hypothetical protein
MPEVGCRQLPNSNAQCVIQALPLSVFLHAKLQRMISAGFLVRIFVPEGSGVATKSRFLR